MPEAEFLGATGTTARAGARGIKITSPEAFSYSRRLELPVKVEDRCVVRLHSTLTCEESPLSNPFEGRDPLLHLNEPVLEHRFSRRAMQP